jgi:hypothetical protein
MQFDELNGTLINNAVKKNSENIENILHQNVLILWLVDALKI